MENLQRQITKRKIGLLLTLTTVTFATALIYISCSKTDIQNRILIDKQMPSTEDKFFNSHRSSNLTEKALVEFVKRENSKEHFVGQTVDQIGYPRWDKIIKQSKANAKVSNASVAQGNKNFSINENSSVTIYYVPFVRDSQNYVNATMVIKASAKDTTINYLCDWQYRNKKHGILQIDTTAESYALFFMRIDNWTLGHTKFNITDPSLFVSSSYPQTSSKQISFVKQSSQSVSSQGVATFLELVDDCTGIYVCVSGTSSSVAPENNCNCGQNNHYSTESLAMPCYYMGGWCNDSEDDSGDDGIGIIGGDGGGGGGGGGSSSSGGGGVPPSPCNTTVTTLSAQKSVATFQAQPCDGNPGWEPIVVSGIKEIIPDTSITKHPNVNCVYDALMQSTLPNILSAFLGDAYNVKFQLGYLNDVNARGKTEVTDITTGKDFLITINQTDALDPDYSRIWLAKTFIHEAFHAMLIQKAYAELGTAVISQWPKNIDDMTLAELSMYYYNWEKQAGTWNSIGHDWMISHIEYCAGYLRSFVQQYYPAVYQTAGSDLKNYIAMFYQGLEGVQCFADDIAARGMTNDPTGQATNSPQYIQSRLFAGGITSNCPN